MASKTSSTLEGSKPDIEAGKAIFRAMQPAKEARLDALKKAIEPYKADVRAALDRGVKKADVLAQVEVLIGHKLTAKKLDDLLGGGTMRANKPASTSPSQGNTPGTPQTEATPEQMKPNQPEKN